MARSRLFLRVAAQLALLTGLLGSVACSDGDADGGGGTDAGTDAVTDVETSTGTDAETGTGSDADAGADGGADADGETPQAPDDPFEGDTCTPGQTPPDNGYITHTPVAIEGMGYEVYGVLGTGDMICYQADDALDDYYGVELGTYVWKRTWGTDFGAIDEDDVMNMTITVDRGFSADGIIFVEPDLVTTERTVSRYDGVPCQPEGVRMIEFIVPHGDPALLGRSFFIQIIYEQQDEGEPELGRGGHLGGSGIYYWDHELKDTYPVMDNRTGEEPLAPASYADRHGESYDCESHWGVPSPICGADGRDCTWRTFELLMASDRVDTALFRGSYLDSAGDEYFGLYLLTVERDTSGPTVRVGFDITPVVDAGDSPAVPGQAGNVEFTLIKDAWINQAGVVVFAAEYDGIGALGDTGIYAFFEGDVHRIVDNRVAATSTTFRRFGAEPLERYPNDEEDAVRTRGTTNLFVNNAGPSGLGNVFFTATVHATTEGRTSGLFVAVPDEDLSYTVHNIVESGMDEIGGTRLGFVCGPFNSLAVNDNNQVLFKSVRIHGDGGEETLDFFDPDPDRPARLLFYDGSTDLTNGTVSVVGLPDEAMPDATNSEYLSTLGRDEGGGRCFTDDLWYIISAYGLNNRGTFMFRAGCLHSGNGTAWGVYRADVVGD